MGAWDSYQSRLSVRGKTKRDALLNRERSYLTRRLSSSLSYHNLEINGVAQNAAVVNSDDLSKKVLYSLPGEEVLDGSLVYWSDSYWLVTSTDPNKEVYTKAIMQRCNHKLRWIAADGNIIERWCVVSDGTKYLTGETSSSSGNNGMSLGDTRIMVSLAKDRYSVQLNREFRFLIDDEDSISVLAYRITKPFKIGCVYNGHGVMNFIMSEVNTEDSDNFELRIADYYKHFPRANLSGTTTSPGPIVPPGTTNSEGKKVWL